MSDSDFRACNVQLLNFLLKRLEEIWQRKFYPPNPFERKYFRFQFIWCKTRAFVVICVEWNFLLSPGGSLEGKNVKTSAKQLKHEISFVAICGWRKRIIRNTKLVDFIQLHNHCSKYRFLQREFLLIASLHLNLKVI